METRLRRALAARRKLRIEDPARTPSAVLIPIYVQDGEYHILFVQRTYNVRDHKGQIAFPGGAWEEKDASLRATALREAEEEVGLPPEAVDILGELDDFLTIGSGCIITPFVGKIHWPYGVRLDGWETEDIIEAPLSTLMDPACLTKGSDELEGKAIETYFYDCKGKVIWGATARILTQLLDIIRGVGGTEAA